MGDRLRAAVAARIADGHEPDDPAAGLYISPEDACADAVGVDLASYGRRLDEASSLIGLDALSREILELCAGPELDPGVGRVFGFLLDDATQRRPTPRLIASLLDRPGGIRREVLDRLAAERPLRSRGCLRLGSDVVASPLLDQPISVAPELTSFLLAASIHESSVDPTVRRRELPAYPIGRTAAVERVRAGLAIPGRVAMLVSGPDAADIVAVTLARPLLLVDVRQVLDAGLLARARLFAALERRNLVLDRVELMAEAERGALAAWLDGVDERVLLCSETSAGAEPVAALGAVLVETAMPTADERRAAWSALAGSRSTEAVAARFRLTTAQIRRAFEISEVEAVLHRRTEPIEDDLESAARRVSSPELGDRAKRISTPHEWGDLVLPGRQLRQLRSISGYLQHRDRVLTDWGFARTTGRRQGLSVLFAGESGTGKTMAASVLANELGLDLFAIDLATVVSKYVGETEQNLDRIFAAAAGSNAILFFDEADALFGRRSAVSDSRDRYANVEVAYLLQRLEAHTGAAILATNLKQNLDDAFLRRLDFVIDFPFPESADRTAIWRQAIPAKAPLAADVDIDFLGERFKLSGGSIRNCALAAAFDAAAADTPIGMAHLVRAVAAEYGKLGRLAMEADFERFHAMLDDPDARVEDPVAPPEPLPPQPPPTATRPIAVRARIEEL